ncbi:MAG: restriction endonuclease [Proteobacteria bacterium]|nr:restriction endonuclease [Pseudomonadota bacterium]
MTASRQKWRDIGAPTYDELIWPTIKALRELGGSATNQELVDKMIELEGYSEEIQLIPHREGRETKLEYRAAWARTYLKKYGAITNQSKGVWILLDKGEALTEGEAAKIAGVVRGQDPSRQKDKKTALEHSEEEEPDEVAEESWKTALLEKLRSMKPDAFERLCQLVLRESGFVRVQVTGRSGDGGIDGIGILKMNLLSFHVSFQCKRYQGSVGSSDLRDFRGAMIGRGDKGIFITTGNFTSEARKEANRDGAPAIDLIDGDELCDLLKKLKLGVQTELIEKVQISQSWFESI